MSKIDLPKLVTALFTFKGTNNDELCFRKGDVITITQTDDGGWWEGTLNDKTGWFPSNYVKECRSPDSSTKSSPEKTSQESPIHQRLNRDIVLKDFLESERANVAELQGLVNNFLQPLELTNVLKKEEYKQLMNNILDVLDTHQRLLNNLETTVIQGPDARVGHLFLSLAPRLKAIHINYCNGHPQTVAIMDKYRDELNDFMERSGAVTPGILVLTTGLSKPFRRLEKYAAMLQELERHTEKNHFDRGDTQRSVSVYRDIAEKCTYARKQRELALQILTSGIKNWEGEDLSTLGEILHVGPVVLAIGADRRDRYFVLFPMTLLVLSTSHRMSSFVYEGKLPLTGIDIIPMDDTDDIKNAFEINGPMIESIIVICSNREERQNWIDYLKQDQSSSSSSSSGIRRSPTTISHVSCTNSITRLSRYYAKLVRKKIIYPELIKKLLYYQYIIKPDLKNVKMRKYMLHYSVHQLNSDNYDTDDDNNSHKLDTKLILNSSDNKQVSSRLKSSIMLDVRYVPDESVSLVNLPIKTTASLGNIDNCDMCRSVSYDNYKSLPANSSTSTTNNRLVSSKNIVLSKKPCQLLNSYSSDDCDDNDNVINTTDKTWKSLGIQKNFDISSDEFIHVDIHPTVLTTISENTWDNGDVADQPTVIPASVSLHSSDSGMADSYHVTSSDLTSYKYCSRDEHRKNKCSYDTNERGQMSHSESENDENKFEHQCICSSPFGSTPRDSQQSTESANNSFINLTPIRVLNNTQNNLQSVSYKIDNDKKRFTEPITFKSHNVSRNIGKKLSKKKDICVVDEEDDDDEEEVEQQVYTSGLYAHWWLKKTIPLDPGSIEQGKLPRHGCLTSNQSNGKIHQLAQECSLSPKNKIPWSVASLRPAAPIYNLKIDGKTDVTDSSRTTRNPNERQFEDDAIILKVIEGYCMTVNARFTVNPEFTDDTTCKGKNMDSCDINRGLPENVEALKTQVMDLQSQMIQLTRQLEEEKQSRLQLTGTVDMLVKRRFNGIDGLVP
ncbi:rho guanine nucleotide exchange factor 7 [Aphidius gifuensis]|uniref:rho guanine nucleotide exchange factor 7 n=1 Tax=Aphidius gifuensis TaxID=684658 RepID=UPI001CDC534D|nr:rho guanine nucleotide exchange factor 7 [Aphidius gifuensis]